MSITSQDYLTSREVSLATRRWLMATESTLKERKYSKTHLAQDQDGESVGVHDRQAVSYSFAGAFRKGSRALYKKEVPHILTIEAKAAEALNEAHAGLFALDPQWKEGHYIPVFEQWGRTNTKKRSLELLEKALIPFHQAAITSNPFHP